MVLRAGVRLVTCDLWAM